MTTHEAIGEALHYYTDVLPNEIAKDPQKILAIVSLANFLLNRETKKSPKGRKSKA